jgi:hypothetical protein
MTFYDPTILMPHQEDLLRDDHERIGVFGGYGSGKTFATYKSDQKHVLITPNGETLIGADTLVQLDNTIRKDFEGDFPLEFVRTYNRQKNRIELINGHIIYFRTLADPDDMRSYNLTRMHILEASGVKHESYIQSQSRVRNDAAVVPIYDANGNIVYQYNEITRAYEKLIDYQWLQTIIESNPDSGWINTDVLRRSGEIHIYNSDQEYVIPEEDVISIISSYIFPTALNYTLSPNYIKSMRMGKPNWWIRRYLEGSFEYSEGLVYANAAANIIEDFEIPKDWPRIVGFDYGLNDNSHFLFGAIDFFGEYFGDHKPAVFYFAEVVMNDSNIIELAGEYKRKYRIAVPKDTIFRTPVMDARSYGLRSKESKKALGALFAEQGCFFKPAQMNMDARIFRTSSLIDHKNIYFFKYGVPNLITELLDYRYPEKTLENLKSSYKPIDRKNHGISSLEFCNMELPRNLEPPEDLKARRKYMPTQKQEIYNPFADLDQKDTDTSAGFGAAFNRRF